MSVEVKTPTREQFDHPPSMKQLESPILTDQILKATLKPPPEPGGRRRSASVHCRQDTSNKAEYFKFSAPGQKKRRYSQYAKHPDALQYASKRKRLKSSPAGQIVLPTKFLLGGNINDPLNLNSLCDEEIDKLMNAKTPQSSPLPTPAHRQKVDVVIPSNITDPLNLNADDDSEMIAGKFSNRKKKRHHKHKRKGEESSYAYCSKDGERRADLMEALKIDTNVGDRKSLETFECVTASNRSSKNIDKIVSPVIPQSSPKMRRRGTLNDGKESYTASRAILCSSESPPHKNDPLKISPPKRKRRHTTTSSKSSIVKFSKKPKFIYGNYNRYYGYRNPSSEEDHRLHCFKKEHFEGKDVLDIGCNVGHMTLTLALKFNPKKIIGVDIDHKLISAARKNIRYYISRQHVGTTNFPISNTLNYGPIAAPPLTSEAITNFPQNVLFLQGNYVIEHDELLTVEKEEYDTILALSLTKWIHLNCGDDGLKRAFKRIFKQLRPGGKLFLEPQPWSSYKKKKNLTEEIRNNFANIKLRPEQFTDFLLSKEVGFSTCEVIDVPFNKSKGFRRPIQLFTKLETAANSPRSCTPGVDATAVVEAGKILQAKTDLKQTDTKTTAKDVTPTSGKTEVIDVSEFSSASPCSKEAVSTDISDIHSDHRNSSVDTALQ
ncbi:hypothetical protein ScPMuIL_008536 [Solemya velum]